MALNDEGDDSSYVQQNWDGCGTMPFHDHEIQEILSLFSQNQELRTLQENLFGISEPINDPQLQLPSNIKPTEISTNKDTLGKRNFKIVEVQGGINKKQKTLSGELVKKTAPVEPPVEQPQRQTRECHNMNERQRRLKINQKIQDLKELLPKQSADILSNKLTILHESVEHIKNLHQLVEHLTERNQCLEQRIVILEADLVNSRPFQPQQFPVHPVTNQPQYVAHPSVFPSTPYFPY